MKLRILSVKLKVITFLFCNSFFIIIQFYREVHFTNVEPSINIGSIIVKTVTFLKSKLTE